MALRVLVVDDDFRVASLHAGVVAGVPDCEVVGQATTLADALGLLDRADLVLADQFLPDGDGLELVGRGDASVLMVTAADDPATIARALRRGAAGYLVKPFDPALLSARVAQQVRFHQAAARVSGNQQSVDALTALLRPAPPPAPARSTTGVTAQAVAKLLATREDSLTAHEVAEAIGVSRATAQRHLSDLVEAGQAELTLRYGITGRPQHHYSAARHTPRR